MPVPLIQRDSLLASFRSGADTLIESLLTMQRLKDFIPAHHPLRPIRQMANPALAKMAGLVTRMYETDAKGGRPSTAAENLVRSNAAAGALSRALGAAVDGVGAVQKC